MTGYRLPLFVTALAIIVLSTGYAAPSFAVSEFGSPNKNVTGEIFRASPSTAMPGQDIFGLKPQSSIERPQDIGRVAHTHLRIILPPNGITKPPSHNQVSTNLENFFSTEKHDNAEVFASPVNTPSSLACVYELVGQPGNQPGSCNPAYTTANPSGGGGAIAIVDAFDDPTAAQDLAYFSQYSGVAPANFQVVYAGGSAPYISGSRPPGDSSWNVEESLDIEWAHAMAPNAKLYLVEAQSAGLADLFTAVAAAAYLVSQEGGGEVSMSWGSTEFPQETLYDQYFDAPEFSDVVFVASSGDIGSEVQYPSSSPNVLGVGGTTINRDVNGNFISETSWSDSGGGISCCEPRPSYQNTSAIESVVGGNRGVPDISLIADPTTGVAVYLAGQWYDVGGTSLAAPAVAGILNVADYSSTPRMAAGLRLFSTAKSNKSFPSGLDEIESIYKASASTTSFAGGSFRDISSGNCGTNVTLSGYDLCTGLGSPITYQGK